MRVWSNYYIAREDHVVATSSDHNSAFRLRMHEWLKMTQKGTPAGVRARAGKKGDYSAKYMCDDTMLILFQYLDVRLRGLWDMDGVCSLNFVRSLCLNIVMVLLVQFLLL